VLQAYAGAALQACASRLLPVRVTVVSLAKVGFVLALLQGSLQQLVSEVTLAHSEQLASAVHQRVAHLASRSAVCPEACSEARPELLVLLAAWQDVARSGSARHHRVFAFRQQQASG
jgi:hypothetical protein